MPRRGPSGYQDSQASQQPADGPRPRTGKTVAVPPEEAAKTPLPLGPLSAPHSGPSASGGGRLRQPTHHPCES